MSKPVILCVDDEPTILESLEIELHKAFGNDYLKAVKNAALSHK